MSACPEAAQLGRLKPRQRFSYCTEATVLSGFTLLCTYAWAHVVAFDSIHSYNGNKSVYWAFYLAGTMGTSISQDDNRVYSAVALIVVHALARLISGKVAARQSGKYGREAGGRTRKLR